MAIARRDHPALAKGLTEDLYRTLPQAALSWPRPAPDPKAAGHPHAGPKINVQVSVPTVTALAALAAASDLIATMPREAATALARSYTLQQFSIPPPWKARALYLLWHARWEDDSAHRWLRDTIRALVDKH